MCFGAMLPSGPRSAEAVTVTPSMASSPAVTITRNGSYSFRAACSSTDAPSRGFASLSTCSHGEATHTDVPCAATAPQTASVSSTKPVFIVVLLAAPSSILVQDFSRHRANPSVAPQKPRRLPP